MTSETTMTNVAIVHQLIQKRICFELNANVSMLA